MAHLSGDWGWCALSSESIQSHQGREIMQSWTAQIIIFLLDDRQRDSFFGGLSLAAGNLGRILDSSGMDVMKSKSGHLLQFCTPWSRTSTGGGGGMGRLSPPIGSVDRVYYSVENCSSPAPPLLSPSHTPSVHGTFLASRGTYMPIPQCDR